MNIPFSASARTAILIGAENFSNPEGAIIELVKNAYDADSSSCYIFFCREEKDVNKIIILDYGSGMDLQTIEDCWMRIGTDDKLRNVKTKTGRVKSGAKGIGRFALNRLGASTHMITIKDGYGGLAWDVNWKDFFDSNKNVSDITANVDTVNKETAYKTICSIEKHFEISLPKFEHGTILNVMGINDEWTDEKIKHLFSSLGDLIPTFNAPSFNIFLYSDNDKEKYGKVVNEPYEDYDYMLIAQYTKETQSLYYEIYRNELDEQRLETSYIQLFDLKPMSNHPYTLDDFKRGSYNKTIKLSDLKLPNQHLLQRYQKDLGSFLFEFIFLKNNKSDTRDEGNSEKYPYRPFSPSIRKKWLDANQGIKIYRDNFRVRPYGENGDDWLHLSERYANSPGGAGQRMGGYHVRQTQIAGAVEISRTDNFYLEDKSGREGIRDTPVFELFKNVLIGIIGLMETDRNTVMYNLSQLYNIRNPNEKAKKDADKAQNAFSRKNFNALVNGYNVQKIELEQKDSEIQLLRNLASTGLIVTSFAHELRNIATRSDTRSKDLKAALDLVTSEEKVKQLGINKYEDPYFIVNTLKEEDSQVRTWVEFSINSVNRDKRERKIFSIAKYFETFKSNWKTVTDDLNIKLTCDGFSDDMTVKGFYIDFDTIFNNLLSNSIYAIKSKKSTSNRSINIFGRKSEDFVNIDFIDSGKGLDEKYKNNPDEIFNAFESSKTDKDGNVIGTGLGLYIVKTTLAEYKGSSILYRGDIKDGFGLTIKLKLYGTKDKDRVS